MFLSEPSPVTIAVCDGFHLDPVTKRKTLIGVYPHVVAEAFPHAMPPAWIYVPFRGAQSILTLTVRILNGEEMLFEAGGQATFGDAESTYEITVPVNGLTFSKAGVYVVEALADGIAFAR